MRSNPEVKFDSRGLVPVIAQHADEGAVLMLGYADREAVDATMRTGFAHFHSRSRGKLWMKGETSGNRMAVSEIRIDCDGDALLYLCRPEGPTCHRGTVSCFDETIHGERGANLNILGEIEAVLSERLRSDDAGSYTAGLLRGDAAKIRRKIGEEAFETVLASERNDKKNLAEEVADLFFHALVLLKKHGLGLAEVYAELAARRGKRRPVTGSK